ncbi:MAG: DUF4149 domain-containing protein [Proteobacteria bacterium]|nr:DUF4149 domain-containing protein [Pseudomonadota bacterium]
MTVLLGMIFALYAGLVLGVSFIATPAKFMVPSLPMPIALEIGKATFYIFNKVEWIIVAISIVITCFNTTNLHRWWFTGGLLALLLIENYYLLPILNIRTERAITDNISNPNIFHWLYIGADTFKIIIALTGAIWLMHARQK